MVPRSLKELCQFADWRWGLRTCLRTLSRRQFPNLGLPLLGGYRDKEPVHFRHKEPRPRAWASSYGAEVLFIDGAHELNGSRAAHRDDLCGVKIEIIHVAAG